jgi:transposase
MHSAARIDGQIIDQIIWELHFDFSIARISKICHVGKDRVHDVIRAFSRGQRLDHQMGRPRKLTSEIITRIVTVTLTNGSLTDQGIAKMLHDEMGCDISRQSVNNVRHSQHFDFGPPKRVPKLENWHIECRQQFALDWFGELYRDLKQLPLVFSDESRFSLGDDKKWVWQRRGEYYLANLKEEKKYYFSIMVWGAIGKDFKSDLIVCDGNVDSEKYISFLSNSGFFTKADDHFGHFQWLYQQDGATCHTSDYSMRELCKRCIPIPFWPPNSPDLNVIEVVWAIMKRRLKTDGITSKDLAKQAIRQEWDNLSFETINGLINSFENRVRMVQDAGGMTIQPLLNARRTSVPVGYLPDRPVIPLLYPWTSDEDALIRELIEKGEQPTRRHQQRLFPTRNPDRLRNRWKVLKTQLTNARQAVLLRRP